MLFWLLMPILSGTTPYPALQSADYSYCNAQTPPTIAYSYIVRASNWTWIENAGWAGNVQSSDATYGVEGVEKDTINGCFACEYSSSTQPDPYWAALAPGGAKSSALFLGDDEHAVMYGPCFDKAPSKPMICVQHPALYPPAILGEYYYPVQKFVAQPLQKEQDDIRLLAIHPFVRNSGTYTVPTAWGLGKQAIVDNLHTFEIRNISNNIMDYSATSQFMAPFLESGWPKWAQMHCSAGCHRDAMYTQRIFLPGDSLYQDPRYFALSRTQTDDISNPTLIANCRKCPPGTAVYAFEGSYFGGSQYSIFSAPFVQVCRPWFGTLPSLDTGADGLFMRGGPDAIPFPIEEHIKHPQNGIQQFDAVVCQPNTYNRICADRLYQLAPDFGHVIPSCVSCLDIGPGWHTGGAEGAWFCLPPPGFVFRQRAYISSNPADAPYWANGTQWRRRDLWRFELECGGPGQCQQCADMGVPELTPTDFNERFIFGPYLETLQCDANFYCPDSVRQLACPSTRPVSPARSTSVDNCTCVSGSWWNGVACAQCTSVCLPGNYAQKSLCPSGATADPPCAICTNLNSSTSQDWGLGYELSPGIGNCSFTCKVGYVLSSSYACVPMTAVKLLGSNTTSYYSRVSTTFDKYAINAAGDPTYSQYLLTQLLDAAAVLTNSSDWRPNNILICAPLSGIPQYITAYTGWAAVECRTCPNVTSPDNGGFLAPLTAYTLAACAESPSCPAAYYLNASKWECQSCVTRQNATCSAGTFLHGQGCLGSKAQFNASNPAADCLACSINAATLPDRYYLQTTAGGGCVNTSCPALLATAYPAVPCGGTNPGVSLPCPTGCPAGTFNMNRGVTCGPSHYFSCQSCSYNADPGKWYSTLNGTNCSAYQDVSPQSCPAGSYCVGGPSQPQPCPPGLTSDIGTSSIARCFCPAGLFKQQALPSSVTTCSPVVCPGASALGPPGPAQQSPYYLYQDPLTRVTTCRLCGAGSTARGSMIGVDSCTCSSAATPYPTLSTDGLNVSQCTSCPACSPMTTRLKAACPVCATSMQPPFSTLAPLASYTCVEPYYASPGTPTTALSAALSASATGSSLHIPSSSSWIPLVDLLPFSTCDPLMQQSNADINIAHVAVSSAVVVLSAQVEPSAVVFWANAPINGGSSATVWGSLASVGTAGPVQCYVKPPDSAYTTPAWEWDVIPDTSQNQFTYSIDALAVGPWVASATTTISIAVAAVVRTTAVPAGTTSLSLYAIFPSTSSITALRTGGGLPLSLPGTPLTAQLGIAGTTIVGMSHIKSFPTINTPLHGTFVVAYNSALNLASPCGLVFVKATDAPASLAILPSINNLCDHTRPKGLLSFATSDATPSNPVMFLLFANDPTKVYSARVVLNSVTMIISVSNISPHTWLSSGATLSSIASVWLESSSTPPLLVGLADGAPCDNNAAGGSLSTNCIVAADSVERKMVSIPSMPFGSSPRSIAGTILSTKTLITSTTTGIYALSMLGCDTNLFAAGTTTTVSQYWAGTQCAQQRCIRRVPCAGNEESDGTVCQCAHGFYRNAGVCIACTPGQNYCPGGDSSQACGSQLSTSSTSSPNADPYSQYSQCLCSRTGSYFPPSGPLCALCDSTSISYCPDKWNIIPCPGTVDASLMSIALGTTTPAYCVCGDGLYGPGCIPCPPNNICPRNINPYNMAQLFVIKTPKAVLNDADIAALSATLNGALQVYYNGQVQSLIYGSTPSEYVHLYVYNVSHATNYRDTYRIMVMVQQRTEDRGWVGVVTGATNLLSTQTQGAITSIVTDDSYTGASIQIPASRPEKCGELLQVPNPSKPTQCMCAAGAYTTTPPPTLKCALCKSLTFSSKPDSDTCANCPSGWSTGGAAGATNCTTPIPIATSETSTMPSISIIVGVSVGGVVVLGGIFYVWASSEPTKLTPSKP